MTTTGVQPPTVDWMVDRYIKVRNKIAEVKKQQAEALAPFNVALAELEGLLMSKLIETGAESMRTEAGTFFTVTRTSAKVTEWSKTLDYILENKAFDLLEARVNKTAADAILTETQAPIPGVEITREKSLNVRTATAKP